MARLVLVVALAACGRVGFSEGGGGGGGGGGDARPGDARGSDGGGPGSDARDAPATAATYYQISTLNNVATLFTVDLASGQLAQVGTFATTIVMGGLAYGGANTLYAAGIGVVYRITLAPFSATQIQTFSGSLQTLEHDGTNLVGVLDGTHSFVAFPPGGTMAAVNLNTTTTAAGGDVLQNTDGTWYWYTNTNNQLYTINPISGAVTAVGSPATTAPYCAGMLHDDNGRLYLTSASTAQILEISTTTGQLVGSPVTMCTSCPTAAMLGPGDATRTP